MLNTVRLKSDIVELIGEDRIARSIIRGGSSGISCWKSYVSPFTGDMEVTVEYDIRLPVPISEVGSGAERDIYDQCMDRQQRQRRGSREDSGIVLCHGQRAVYHEDPHCSYLELSIRFVPADGLDSMRNVWGRRYHACDKCVFGQAMTGVYVTEDGTKYHNSLSCSGLKRTVHAVEKSEIAGLGGCSRCSG